MRSSRRISESRPKRTRAFVEDPDQLHLLVPDVLSGVLDMSELIHPLVAYYIDKINQQTH